MKGYIAFINMSTKVDAIMKTPKTQIVLISTCSVLNAIASSASSGNKSNGMLNKAATISFGMKSLGSASSRAYESFSTFMKLLIALLPHQASGQQHQSPLSSALKQRFSMSLDHHARTIFFAGLSFGPYQAVLSGRHGLKNQIFRR